MVELFEEVIQKKCTTALLLTLPTYKAKIFLLSSSSFYDLLVFAPNAAIVFLR